MTCYYLYLNLYYIESLDPSTDQTTKSESSKVQWRKANLPLTATLPAFIVATLIHCLFLFNPLGRLIYLFVATCGSVLGIVYCHFVY